jgi:hypothetical protein
MAASGRAARDVAGDYPITRTEGREMMTIPIPHDVRQLLDAPNYVHLPAVRADGSARLGGVGGAGPRVRRDRG